VSVAYVDSSCVVAISFGERGTTAIRRRLERFDELVSSNLLECEVRSAAAREHVETDLPLLASLSWVLPDRPLGPEIARVLEAGYVRGADCWHLATALYLAGDPKEMAFLTLDARQAAAAAALGFKN
jgi:predicted nucleic acid-binding protein